MEHIEEAGVHSGDSSCTLPPITLGSSVLAKVREATAAIAHGVGVRGLLNVQYALHGDVLYVLEANPRARRTVPFVSKATSVPLAKAAARIMLGATIADLRGEGLLPATGDGGALPADSPVAVKEAVLPFNRFRTKDGLGVDPLLGPEMKSTGEVMGFDRAFGPAFAKSQAAAYGSLPVSGTVFVSIADRDKRAMVFPVRRLADIGFQVLATEGTAEMLRRNGIDVTVVRKHSEGSGPETPTIVDTILAGDVDLIVNTPVGNPGPARRRLRDPRRRGVARGAVHHHGAGDRCRGAGHRGADLRRARRAVAAAGARGAEGEGVSFARPARRGRRRPRAAVRRDRPAPGPAGGLGPHRRRGRARRVRRPLPCGVRRGGVGGEAAGGVLRAARLGRASRCWNGCSPGSRARAP
ncbi:hypothetical protein L7F22_009729 [Adiantum nelumboides]|nr:hypothetical protein [Adiantum nelumboides]